MKEWTRIILQPAYTRSGDVWQRWRLGLHGPGRHSEIWKKVMNLIRGVSQTKWFSSSKYIYFGARIIQVNNKQTKLSSVCVDLEWPEKDRKNHHNCFHRVTIKEHTLWLCINTHYSDYLFIYICQAEWMTHIISFNLQNSPMRWSFLFYRCEGWASQMLRDSPWTHSFDGKIWLVVCQAWPFSSWVHSWMPFPGSLVLRCSHRTQFWPRESWWKWHKSFPILAHKTYLYTVLPLSLRPSSSGWVERMLRTQRRVESEYEKTRILDYCF